MPDHDITLVDCSLAHAKILAAIHAECFDDTWSALEFETLLISPGVFGCVAEFRSEPAGFLLCRAVADECEILTIGVLLPHRRCGIAGKLIGKLIQDMGKLKIAKIFLEVAETNEAARNLYSGKDFVEIGRRENYYNKSNGRVDGLILAKTMISKTT